jgi:N-methylhydantoinase A
VQTSVSRHDLVSTADLNQRYAGLAAQAGEALDKEGFPREQHVCLRTADLRYFGQAFEVRVSVPDGELNQAAIDSVAAAFHEEHRSLYGYDFAGDPAQHVEWVNLRVSGIGPIRRPQITPAPASGQDPEPNGRRAVCFAPADGYVDTPVYWRPDLAPGQVVRGPAIVEEFGSTVPLHPGFVVHVDAYNNLVVRRQR